MYLRCIYYITIRLMMHLCYQLITFAAIKWKFRIFLEMYHLITFGIGTCRCIQFKWLTFICREKFRNKLKMFVEKKIEIDFFAHPNIWHIRIRNNNSFLIRIDAFQLCPWDRHTIWKSMQNKIIHIRIVCRTNYFWKTNGPLTNRWKANLVWYVWKVLCHWMLQLHLAHSCDRLPKHPNKFRWRLNSFPGPKC